MNLDILFDNNKARMDALYAGKDQKARYSALLDLYRQRFGSDPEAFVSAPGRTEVIGNHTDHQHGRVLAAAVDLDTVAAVAANGTSVVRLFSEGMKGEFVIDLNDLSVHEEQKNTTHALIRGVAARLKELGYAIGGFNAQVTSTVFKGSGLSSSAAFEVLIVAIFDALFNGWVIDPQLNACISQYTENVYFGKPCGLMDQMASSVGGLVTIDFAPDPAKVEAISYDFRTKGYSLCVVAAGGEHGKLTDAYAAVPAEMRAVAQAMGHEILCGITGEELEAALPGLKNKVSDRAILRAFHYVDETKRTGEAVAALRADDLQSFFRAIIASGESSWKLLQNLHVEGSSNQEMPLALEMSRRMLEGSGAWRIHGGGFAGTILAFVPSDLLEKYINTMNAVFGEGATTVLNIRPEGAVCIR